jgi:hypothetical protein
MKKKVLMLIVVLGAMAGQVHAAQFYVEWTYSPRQQAPLPTPGGVKDPRDVLRRQAVDAVLATVRPGDADVPDAERTRHGDGYEWHMSRLRVKP